jgi:hypothetical protein
LVAGSIRPKEVIVYCKLLTADVPQRLKDPGAAGPDIDAPEAITDDSSVLDSGVCLLSQ